ncbi:DUF2017 family protein [Cryobacterium sp. PH31-O1]|uniref:DUF2017 family protein n=1 Tax=Cryobacterium sp. PH31-O1 TaxID=3046306 RepID=UPI0024BA3363|nr:DUF2017 family protein [Cryobacterium sp. PH31-O1]MDJ0338912.1 DUF2017 family protein [Cryobacterium sp. PH31-O1]
MSEHRFTRLESGALLARFAPVEADLLRLATSQLVDMLAAGAENPQLAASDGVFGRLLPDAYRDDDEAAAEFRRFTATGLLERKAQNAQILLGSLGDAADSGSDTNANRRPVTISLDDGAVQAWLRSLTDLRLTLAERLQISPDGVVQLDGDDTPFLRELYEWLGMLQEELVYTIDV